MRGRGIDPEVRLYLDDPPTRGELERLIERLGVGAHDLLRPSEPAYAELRLSPQSTDGEIVEAILARPILLQRPICDTGDAAVIGRPPERVLELFGE